MCGWGPYAREASVWEACCRYCDVINMFLNCQKKIWSRSATSTTTRFSSGSPGCLNFSAGALGG